MLEVTAISNKLGLPIAAFEDETKFDAAFNDPKTGYIARAKATEDEGIAKHFNDAHGDRLGKMQRLQKSLFKELGVEEFEGELIEDQLKSAVKGVKTLFAKITEDAGKTADTRVTELTTELGTFKTKYESERERADNANNLLTEKTKEYDTFKSGLTFRKLYDQEYAKVKFDPGADALKLKGFNTTVQETFDFKLSADETEVEVYRKGEKKRAKTGAGNIDLTVEAAVQLLGDEHGVTMKNNLNREQPRRPEQPQPTNGQPERIPRTGR